MMMNRQNKIDQAVAWRDHAMTDLKYARDHSGSARVREFTTTLEAAMWRSTCLCAHAMRDLEEVCLGRSGPVEHDAKAYECLRNLLPEFRKDYLDLHRMLPLWEAAAHSAQDPRHRRMPDDVRDRLLKGAINATQVIDHALGVYRSVVESANGFEIAPRRRPTPAARGHNTIRDVVNAIMWIRRNLPKLELDIVADQAQLSMASTIPAAFRRLSAEIMSLTQQAHCLHVEMVKQMDGWLLSSGPLAFDQSAYLGLRQRLFDFSDVTGHVCRHYGYTRMKSGPRPDAGLCKRLWGTVDLAKRIIADSLNACEELVMAATGLPVKPQLWRNDDE